MRGNLIVSVGLLLLVLPAMFISGCPIGGPPASAPAGEYGDAPDGGATGYPTQWPQIGEFPTLFGSNGARTLSTADATLGPNASMEVDANDPADPDEQPNLDPTNTDSDDGLVNLFITLTQIPPPTHLTVDVNGPEDGAGGLFYLNVLIDLDMDGNWGGEAAGGECEWVVKNHEVTVIPGESEEITPPPFAFSNGNRLPDGAWMRIALTGEEIAGEASDGACLTDWDGTGEFGSGEIEDHVILLPEFPDDDEKEVPNLIVDCNGPYRFPKNSPAGAAKGPVKCVVTNRAAAGFFNCRLIRVDVNGNVNMGTVGANLCQPPAPGPGPVPIGAAGGGGNVVTLDCGDGVKADNNPARAQYKMVVTADDPDAVLFVGGIHIGWSAESSAEFEFAEEADEPTCGDENLDDGEECDDGNNADGDGCSAICTIEEDVVPTCGDGTLDVGEECDDGNNVNGDGCSAICTIEEDVVPICGDGTLDVGEECDDGNNVDGDGCSAVCTVEGSICSELAGAVTADFTITYDPLGHGPFIDMPGTLDLEFIIDGDGSVTGPPPFVDVTGVATGGSFIASGTGTVAGNPDIEVGLTCICGDRTCTYQMGISGGLPGGDLIEYSFDVP